MQRKNENEQDELSLIDAKNIVDSLPLEIIFKILEYLELKYINRFAITNKAIQKTIEDTYPLYGKIIFFKKEEKCTYTRVNQILNQQYQYQCQHKKIRKLERKELGDCILIMLGLVAALYMCQFKIDEDNRVSAQLACVAGWVGLTIFSLIREKKTQQAKTNVERDFKSLPKVELSGDNSLPSQEIFTPKGRKAQF